MVTKSTELITTKKKLFHFLWHSALSTAVFISLAFVFGFYIGIKFSSITLQFDTFLLKIMLYTGIVSIVFLLILIHQKHHAKQIHMLTQPDKEKPNHSFFHYLLMIILIITLILLTTILSNYYLGTRLGILIPGILFLAALFMIKVVIRQKANR